MLQKKNAYLDRRSYLFDIVELVNNLKYLKMPKSFKEALVPYELTYIKELACYTEIIDDINFDFEIASLLDKKDKKVKPAAVSVVINGSCSNKIIKRIRALTDCPILMRDFVISPLQIFEAKEAGASAFTLIPSVISYRSLKEFVALADGLELACIPEISDTTDVVPLINAGVRYLLITPNLSAGTDNLINLLSRIPSNIIKILHFPSCDISKNNNYFEIGINSIII